MLRIPNAGVYGQYLANFDSIKNNSVKVTSSSQTTARVDSSDERVPRDNSADPDE